jgi:diguanylate cyclase (GGDEF)-like protein
MTARRALQGLALSVGAPTGWLLIRLAAGSTVRHELASQPGLYAYMFFGTAVAFALFGAIGGSREERLEEEAREFEDLATTDSLTKLRNRRYFLQRLQEAVAAAHRGEGSLGLAILDIDHFKKVNDTLGHHTGDKVLVTVGRALALGARAGETAARIGGEELALILPGADLRTTLEAAERIRRAASAEVAKRRALPDGWSLTLSAGVTAVPAGTSCATRDLLMAADRALYRAKNRGRDCVEAEAV